MDKVYNFLLNEVNIKYGDSIIVAVSGGPDSMCLLNLLLRIKKGVDIEIVCAHVNHNTGRSGQIEEQKYVEKYCKLNNIVFETLTIDEYGDDNFHNEAHNIRYNYFDKLAKKYNSKYLFTAHHGDDLIETILMRIVRGSTLRGYSGFSKIVQKSGYKIIRPLIEVQKSEIIDYNKKNKIKYYIDSSNLKDNYTRNRYRKYILPKIKSEEENAHLKFYKFSKTLIEYNNFIDKIVKSKINSIYTANVLRIEKFLEEDKIIQMKIIYTILENIYQDDLMMISDKHAEILYDLIISKKANSKIYLPNDFIAIKSYDTMEIARLNFQSKEYDIELNEFINLSNGKNIEIIKESKDNGNDICRLNSEDIKLPLRIRTRKNGDKMSIKGMIGRKKINDIFIDSKISMSEREEWPILTDSEDNILWLPGLKKSKFNKTKEENCDIIIKYY